MPAFKRIHSAHSKKSDAKTNKESRASFFVFHHAGGSSSAYVRWRDALPDDIELVLAELPGRGALHRERACENFGELIAGLLPDFLMECSKPSILFGHSLGALVAYELARVSRKSEVRGVVLSSLAPPVAPGRSDSRVKIAHLPEAEFIRSVSSYAPIPDQVLADEATRSYFIGLLRSDIRLLESYLDHSKNRALPRSTVSMIVLAGRDDAHVPSASLRDWAELGPLARPPVIFPGGHFYITTEYSDAIRLALNVFGDTLFESNSTESKDKTMTAPQNPGNLEMNKPREVGRAAVMKSVPPDVWAKNMAFTDEIKQMIAKHRLSRHPVAGLLNTEKLNPEISRTLHLEFAYAFAQIFTDSLVYAMASSSELEARLGPLGKVSARFLLQLNLLDELGFAPSEGSTGDYAGNPYLAHYMQFASTLKELGSKPEDILNFKPSPAAKASRKTFTDYYHDHTLLTCVLACAESVFSLFAGPWAKSVSMSTNIDTSKGYHAIHVEDEHGDFIDDEHSEDSWYIFRQAITPERYDEIRNKVATWLDIWYDFGDNVIHVARTISKK